ncbi:MAG: SHOCT domain-containing protein [Bacillota bacterium]|nr:SHOCT domain-containing protein [Bacillota bacterium]
MFCRGFGPMGYGFASHGYFGGGFMLIMMVFRLLILIGIVVLAVKLFKKYTNNSSSVIRILDEKFAKGEISEEEYIKRKSILKQKN